MMMDYVQLLWFTMEVYKLFQSIRQYELTGIMRFPLRMALIMAFSLKMIFDNTVSLKYSFMTDLSLDNYKMTDYVNSLPEV